MQRRRIYINDKITDLKIYIIPGVEQYKPINIQFYRTTTARCAIVLYDVTKQVTFDAVFSDGLSF